MDYTDITHCLKILNEKPKWFFQKENIADKLQCFDTIQQLGTPNTIYSLIGFLRSENALIQARAAETILHLFTKLKSLNDYADALKHLPIEKSDLDFYRVDFDETTYIQLLGIASLNRNGYVREKAVKELSRLKNADGLKFILLRLGDWVEAVRKGANEAVSFFLEDAYIDAWLRQLSVIDWLLDVKRVDLREVHSRILQFIVNRDFSEDFSQRIERLDDKTRFRFYKSFLVNKSPTQQQIFRIAEDKNFLVRTELLKHLTLFEQATQKELLEQFLQDTSATVRLKALYASKPFSPAFDHKIDALLSDEATSVRELSRHLLKQRGLDFAQLYRQRIAGRQFLLGSLLGLSETGSQEDLPTFEQNIQAKSNKLVVASLIAINKFDSNAAKHYALELLVHKSNRVRNKAGEILAKHINGHILERVRGIYAFGDYEIKKSVLKVFNRIGGWSVIGDLLLALGEENINIQNLAWQLIHKWKLNATRLFTTPARADVERANQIYDNLDQRRLRMTDSRSGLLQDLRFYLS
jgi:HEAT repeat protein